MKKITLLLMILSTISLHANKIVKTISLANHHKINKIEKIIIAKYQYTLGGTIVKNPKKIVIIDDKKKLIKIKELLGKINSKGSICKKWFIKNRLSIYILYNKSRYCKLEIINSRLSRVGGFGLDNLKEEKELVQVFNKFLGKEK